MKSSKALAAKRGISLKRVLGVSLMIFSALGLVISLFGLLAVCKVSGPFAQSADEALTLSLTALNTTSQSLDLVQSALGEAQDALGAVETVILDTGDGLHNTGALMGSLSDALAGDLPQVILRSQHSLTAAEEGAAVIERMLHGLNVISALTGVTYDPDVSLTESFARLNQSLDDVPQTLAEVDGTLNAVQDNLNSMQPSFTDLTGTLKESEAILAEMEASIDDYNGVIQELSLKIGGLQESLPNWIRIVTFALYFLLIWLAVSQIGLLWQGWEMVSYHPAQVEARLRELEQQIERLPQEAKE